MAIVKMKKLRLMAVRSQRESLLRELMLLGCVEITDPAAEPEDEALSELDGLGTAELTHSRAEQTALLGALRLLDRYAPQKQGLLTPQPETTLAELLDESSISADLALADKLLELDERIRRAAASESRERAQIESLLPWENMDIPLDCTGTETSSVVFGAFPVSLEESAIYSALDSVTDMAALYSISEDKNQRCMALICLREKQDEIMAALRPLGFAVMAPGGLKGTARDNICQAEERIKSLTKEKESLIAEIVAEAPRRAELELRTDTLGTKIARAEAAAKLLCTESAFLFKGWIPAVEEADLAGKLAKYDCAWEVEDPDPENPEEVPVKLSNNSFTRPFSMVTEMYSLPAYNGIDPNPFLFITFSIFFGIMFADIGYGALLLIVGLLLKFKRRAKGGMGHLAGIAIASGAGAMFFGAITGGLFGDIVPQVAQFFGGSANLPSLIDPMKDPMTILIICLGIGVVHMLVGVTIGGYMQVRDGQLFDALCDAGTVYLTFIGVAIGALGITWWIAILSLVLVVLAQGRESKSIGGKLGSGLWGLYNFVTGWFGDILSYCRLMALMLAGSVIAQVFNTLGAMTGNILAFLVIFLLGHALNFGLNVIGTYVHSSRLEYLEFFGKFYREGGRAFRPLSVDTNYYNIRSN